MTHTYAVCGVPISSLELEAALTEVKAAAEAGRPLQVHLCNSYTLSLVDRDERLRNALMRADLNLPDGAPVAWLSPKRLRASPVRGPSLMRSILLNTELRHYLYGGAPQVAEDLVRRLPPAVSRNVVGSETPPYTDLSEDGLTRLADRIRSSGANIVWVGLGTPRQDHLVPLLAPLVNCPVVPVGAAFDFLAGRVAEAPEFLHGTGFEWLYRLWREPRRLWRRYLIGSIRFAWRAALAHRSTAKQFG